MRRYLTFSVLLLTILAVTCATVPRSLAQSSTEGVQVITVTAKKYEFEPSPIRVKQGTKVRLNITATDHETVSRSVPFPTVPKRVATPVWCSHLRKTAPKFRRGKA